MIAEYTALEGQSIYDVCANTYGDLNKLRKLITDNNIGSVNDQNLARQVFKFDTSLIKDNSLFNVNNNSNVIYATKGSGEAYLIRVSGGYVLQNGFKIIIK
jgi:hypothetical protein